MLDITWMSVIFVSKAHPHMSNRKDLHKVRSLFLDLVTSNSSSISYWNNLFDDIKWAYVWSVPQNFFLKIPINATRRQRCRL